MPALTTSTLTNTVVRGLLTCCMLVMPFSTPLADTVRDNFGSAAYNNNDGSANWSSNWLEINESDGASSGSIRVTTDLGNGRLMIGGGPGSNREGAERSANLTGATSATLSFDYRRDSLDNANEYVSIEVSTDGVNWFELDTFSGPQNDGGYQSVSYDISGYISATTRIRFLGSTGLDGNPFFSFDQVYFDNVEIDYTLLVVPHFAISHDGYGDLCQAESITLTKHDASHSIDSGYTGLISLSTTSTNVVWSNIGGNGVLTDTGNGTATYDMVAADNGQVVLGLRNTIAETVNINISAAGQSEYPSEDADLTFSNLITETYRDEFESVAYNNNDGSASWAGDWSEINEADGAPDAGDIRITTNLGGNRLRIRGNNSSTREGIERGVDLSGVTAATLSFDYRRVSLDNGNEYVTIEISSDGGANWTELDRFRGPQNDASYQSTSYDITAYISATTRIRFLGSSGLDGPFFFFGGDQVYFDNIQISATTTATCANIDHFLITHDGTALTCNPESVTISACATADCSSLYTDPVSVTLSPGGWVGGDTQTFSGGSGAFELRHTTAEAVSLDVSSSAPAAAGSAVCFNSADSSNSCSLTYYDSGFIYTIPTQTSCQASANITVSAVRMDVTSQQCVPSFANRSESLNFWTSYANPATGGNQVTLNNGSSDYVLATASPGTGVPLSFDANGEATVTLAYPDAGQLTLNSRFDGAGAEAGLVMLGATNYVTKPAKFYVYSLDANADCASGDASCTAFFSAGADFNLNVRAACADNSLTPNFQHNGISLSHNLVAPAAGNLGALGVSNVNISAADNGEVSINNQNISEVGVFTLTAALDGGTNYLGETSIGDTVTNTSANIGRFYPDYFDVDRLHGCNADSFTYSQQPFSVNITAYNSSAAQTQNYEGAFVKDPVVSNAGDSSLFSNNTFTSTEFSNGFGSRTDVTYTFASKDTAPETITLRAVDDDNVSSAGHSEPTTEIRSGRLRIENAYGSELTDLAVPITVQYFDGSGYVINNLDNNCTNISVSLSDPDATDSLVIGDGGSAGQTCLWDDDAESGANNCSNAGVLPGPVAEQFEEPPVAGNFNAWLKAPGEGRVGHMDLTGSAPVWLQYDWTGAGLSNPSGRASFGLYRGDDRIIYWREQF